MGIGLFWRLDEVRKLNKTVHEVTASLNLGSFSRKGAAAESWTNTAARELRMGFQGEETVQLAKDSLHKHEDPSDMPQTPHFKQVEAGGKHL